MKIEIRDFDSHTNTCFVSITGIDFCADVLGEKKNLCFWLEPDEADKLVFHLSSALQEVERKKTTRFATQKIK
jgi:hypothetical protein